MWNFLFKLQHFITFQLSLVSKNHLRIDFRFILLKRCAKVFHLWNWFLLPKSFPPVISHFTNREFSFQIEFIFMEPRSGNACTVSNLLLLLSFYNPIISLPNIHVQMHKRKLPTNKMAFDNVTQHITVASLKLHFASFRLLFSMVSLWVHASSGSSEYNDIPLRFMVY